LSHLEQISHGVPVIIKLSSTRRRARHPQPPNGTAVGILHTGESGVGRLPLEPYRPRRGPDWANLAIIARKGGKAERAASRRHDAPSPAAIRLDRVLTLHG
jgi:hypothetical protein